jgi:hypothetical protein
MSILLEGGKNYKYDFLNIIQKINYYNSWFTVNYDTVNLGCVGKSSIRHHGFLYEKTT